LIAGTICAGRNNECIGATAAADALKLNIFLIFLYASGIDRKNIKGKVKYAENNYIIPIE
jgi:hypothetical protein